MTRSSRGRRLISTNDAGEIAAATNARRLGWRLLRDTMVDQRSGLGVGVVVGLCWTAAKVAVPSLIGDSINVINDQIDSASRGAVVDSSKIVHWALIIGIAAVVAALFTGLRRYWAFRESRRSEVVLRDRVFSHVQHLHFGFHDRTPTGELMSRANTDLQQIQNLIVLIPLTISNAVTVLAVTVILVSKDPFLALLALGSLPFLNILGKRFSTRLHPEVLAIQAESAQLASVVEETVAGVRVVKGFGAQPFQEARLHVEADDVFDASMRAARVRARFLPGMEILPNVGLIAVLWYGGQQVIDGSLLLGDLITFNIYIGLLIWPLRMLGMIIAQAQRAAASAGRVAEVLEARTEIMSPTNGWTGSGTGAGASVEFASVDFGYESGTGEPVLRNFDLTIESGESVALVGATGSGKSTVARLIPRFYDVQQGVVRLDGRDVREWDLDALRRSVGLVFEDTFLFNATVAENLAFADPDAPRSVVEDAARLAGAHDFILDLPEGYDTTIGERGYSLSGGQRQRLAIARAIISQPRLLILDDATSSVDPTKEQEIRDSMVEVMRGRTTLVIAHRPATIALADRVVLLDGGRVVASGTHEGLLASSEAYRDVLAAAIDSAEEVH